jgi:hypothetical protein
MPEMVAPRLACLTLATLTAACPPCTPGPVTPARVAASIQTTITAIVLNPALATVAPGRTVVFQAAGLTYLGTTIATTVSWAATGGTITAGGVYTAGSTPGWYRVIATVSGGVAADTASVHVVEQAEGGPGCFALSEDGFSNSGGIGLRSTGVGPITVTGNPLVQAAVVTPDPTAPVSPPNILQLSFLPGWQSGTGQDVALRRSLTADYLSLYLSFWFRLDGPAWPGPVAGPDLTILLGSSVAAGGPEVSVHLGQMVGGTMQADLRLSGLASPFGGSTAPVLAGNVGVTPAITSGVWHHMELRVVANGNSDNGSLAWHLDGQAVGLYTGLGFFGGTVPAIRQLGWGANAPAAPLSSVQRVSIDHWYVSGSPAAPASGIGPDQVALPGDNPPASTTTVYLPSTAVLLDARRAETGGDVCWNDLTVLPTGLTASAGDLRDRRDCGQDEIVVFSVEDQAVLEQPGCGSGSLWTDAAGETRTVQLGAPLLELPVSLWMVYYNTVDGSCRNVARAPGASNDDVETATELYNGHGAGIRFSVADSVNLCESLTNRVSGADVTALGLGSNGVSACGRLTSPLPHYDAGRINVYYVPWVETTGGPQAYINGVQCRTVDPNVILISANQRNSTTLAHELGHTLGLEHTGDSDSHNDWPCYPGATTEPSLLDGSNLMWATGVDKSGLTLGQVFRANFDGYSQLNMNGVRIGPSRSCETPHQTGVTSLGVCSPAGFYDQTRVEGPCPSVSRKW